MIQSSAWRNFFEKPVIVVLLLLVLSGYMYFFQLGRMALTDPDETFYAQTAKEMRKKGNGSPLHLREAAVWKSLFFSTGFWKYRYKNIWVINEFAARNSRRLFLPFGLVAFFYLLGRFLFNNRTGIFSAVALATSLEYSCWRMHAWRIMALSNLLLFGVLFFFYGQIRKEGLF